MSSSSSQASDVAARAGDTSARPDVFSFLVSDFRRGSDNPAISVQSPSEVASDASADEEEDESNYGAGRQRRSEASRSGPVWQTQEDRRYFYLEIQLPVEEPDGPRTRMVYTLAPEQYAGPETFTIPESEAKSDSASDTDERNAEEGGEEEEDDGAVRTKVWHSLVIAPRNELLPPTSASRCVLNLMTPTAETWHGRSCTDGWCLGWYSADAAQRASEAYLPGGPLIWAGGEERGDDDDAVRVRCNPWNPYAPESRAYTRLQARAEERAWRSWAEEQRDMISSGVDGEGDPTTATWRERNLARLDDYVRESIRGVRARGEGGARWGLLQGMFDTIDGSLDPEDRPSRPQTESVGGESADDYRTQTVEMRQHAVRKDLEGDVVTMRSAVDRTHHKFCSSVWCPGSRSLQAAIAHRASVTGSGREMTEDDLLSGRRCRPDLEWPFARDEHGTVIELSPGQMARPSGSEVGRRGGGGRGSGRSSGESEGNSDSRSDSRSPRRLGIPTREMKGDTSLSPSPAPATRRWLSTPAWVREVQRRTEGLSLDEAPEPTDERQSDSEAASSS